MSSTTSTPAATAPLGGGQAATTPHQNGTTPAHGTTHQAPGRTTTAPHATTGHEVPCTGPDQRTVCTNPNHGAGTDPNENGSAPTTTTPKVQDGDPGGTPCVTGMGVKGVYVYSDTDNTWVCQIG